MKTLTRYSTMIVALLCFVILTPASAEEYTMPDGLRFTIPEGLEKALPSVHMGNLSSFTGKKHWLVVSATNDGNPKKAEQMWRHLLKKATKKGSNIKHFALPGFRGGYYEFFKGGKHPSYGPVLVHLRAKTPERYKIYVKPKKGYEMTEMQALKVLQPFLRSFRAK